MLLNRVLFCLPLLVLVLAAPASGFGVDVCFNDPASVDSSGQKKNEPSLIRNCIGVSRSCRREPLQGPATTRSSAGAAWFIAIPPT